jgi:prepilin-type N-terminal cleavage/methylation domain-containing protein
MTTHANRRRGGFTLLEILLASAIAVLLLAALYVSFDIVLKQTDAGREAVAQGDLSRAVVNRMTIDLANCLGLMPPKSGGEQGSATSADSETSGATAVVAAATAATGSSSSGSSNAAASGSTSGSSGSSSSSSTATNTPFGAGVVGTSDQLMLFVSRVPPTLANRETAVSATGQPPADLMRVTYYKSSSGKGLCRQVRPWVTADGVWNSTDPDRSTEDGDLLAEEILDIMFEYFDGSTWQSQWDGTQTQTDGATLQGPPRAIRATMTLQLPNGTSKQIQHVFPIRAAVGLYVPQTSSMSGSSTGSSNGTTAGSQTGEN